MLDVSYAAKTVQVCLKVVIITELFVTGGRDPDSWCHDIECLGLETDPCRQQIE